MCEIIHRGQNRQDLECLRWAQKSEAQILFANQALRGSYRAAVLANLADERENRRSPAILLNTAQGPGVLDPRASPPPQSPPRRPQGWPPGMPKRRPRTPLPRRCRDAPHRAGEAIGQQAVISPRRLKRPLGPRKVARRFSGLGSSCARSCSSRARKTTWRPTI